jgi:maleylpyruvate isomerase
MRTGALSESEYRGRAPPAPPRGAAHPPALGRPNGYGRAVTDPLVLVTEAQRATDRLIETAETLDSPSAPSLLPGWSRGHVLTHVARNADGMVNLLTWARTGVVTPQYASAEVRAADIEAGSGRPLHALIEDVRDSADRFTGAAGELRAEHWMTELALPGGAQIAALIPWRRLREVEVHHVDLAAGYRSQDWPESFGHRLLHEVSGGLRGVDLTVRAAGTGHELQVGAGGPPVVLGSVADLAAWLTGRSGGTGLRVDPPGALPALPNWM